MASFDPLPTLLLTQCTTGLLSCEGACKLMFSLSVRTPQTLFGKDALYPVDSSPLVWGSYAQLQYFTLAFGEVLHEVLHGLTPVAC